jgi:hypothetical protein
MSSYPPAATNPEKEIRYSSNWNGKLHCQFHTTIRLYNTYWKQGDFVKIVKQGVFLYRGRIVKMLPFLLHDLREITAYLDTGYGLEETKNILQKMYPGKDWNTQKLVILLVENIEYSH